MRILLAIVIGADSKANSNGDSMISPFGPALTAFNF